MGNRLSKIYTRTGDDGTSGMADGTRLPKNDIVFAVMGDIDELNSHLGMVLALLDKIADNARIILPAYADKEKLTTQLTLIQHLLFNLGGEIALPAFRSIHEQQIIWLERQIDEMNEHLSPLKEFILPRGNELICQIHIARTITRRSERQYVALSSHHTTNPYGMTFLNRLSDYLFVLSRFVTPTPLIQETLWQTDILKQIDCQ